MIPWRFTIETDLSPEQVLDKLVDLSDSRPTTLREFFFPQYHYSAGRFFSTMFAGHVDRKAKSFHLHNYLWPGDYYQTSYGGSLYRDGLTTRIKVLGSFTTGPTIFLSSLLLLSIGACWWGFDKNRMVIIWPAIIVTYYITRCATSRRKARRLFRDLFVTKTLPAARSIWPEIDRFKPHTKTGEPEIYFEAGSADPELVNHFTRYVRLIAGNRRTPPHSLSGESDGKPLTLTFPAQSSNGFDVRATVDDNGLIVWAGRLARMSTTDIGHPRDQVELAFGTIRDLLSPTCKLREYYLDGLLCRALVEYQGDEIFAGVDDAVSTSEREDELVEKEFVNRQMPIKPDS